MQWSLPLLYLYQATPTHLLALSSHASCLPHNQINILVPNPETGSTAQPIQARWFRCLQQLLVWCRHDQAPAGPNNAHTWRLYSITPVPPAPEPPQPDTPSPMHALQHTLSYMTGLLTWATAPWKWPKMSWSRPTATASAGISDRAAELISDDEPTLAISPSGAITVRPEVPLQPAPTQPQGSSTLYAPHHATALPEPHLTISDSGEIIPAQLEPAVHPTPPPRPPQAASSAAAGSSSFHRTYVVKAGKVASDGIEEVTESPRVAAVQRLGQQQQGQEDINSLRRRVVDANGVRAQQHAGIAMGCYASCCSVLLL